jgi:ubiquinone/menaquinone biosynthesis C-methylase UbiE
LWSHSSLGKGARLPEKQTKKSKKTGSIIQVVENLFSKYEALNSILSTAKKKKERKKDMFHQSI